MSDQTRRLFLRKSAVTTVGLGALATGAAAAEDTEKLTAKEAEQMRFDPADLELAGGDVTTQASWPVTFSFDMAPSQGKAGNSPAIVEGAFYNFDINYSPELTVALGFFDTGTSQFDGYTVSGSGLYQLEAPVSIPENSAGVGIVNPSENSRAVSGDLTVDN